MPRVAPKTIALSQFFKFNASFSELTLKALKSIMNQAKLNSASTFVIPYDRQELADYLEVDRSGLSAEISKLRKEGVLASERRKFTLLTRI